MSVGGVSFTLDIAGQEQNTMECNCWVSLRPAEEAYGIRYGAHATTCPVFRESGDPVDRAYDTALRNEHQCQHCGEVK